jgi:hypothetical protein
MQNENFIQEGLDSLPCPTEELANYLGIANIVILFAVYYTLSYK